jgi:hypothetical protein
MPLRQADFRCHFAIIAAFIAFAFCCADFHSLFSLPSFSPAIFISLHARHFIFFAAI